MILLALAAEGVLLFGAWECAQATPMRRHHWVLWWLLVLAAFVVALIAAPLRP